MPKISTDLDTHYRSISGKIFIYIIQKIVDTLNFSLTSRRTFGFVKGIRNAIKTEFTLSSRLKLILACRFLINFLVIYRLDLI